MASAAMASEAPPGPFATPGGLGGPQQSQLGPSGFASTANPNASGRDDPATVQDTNFAVFFGHFLRVFRGPPAGREEEEDGEGMEGLPADIGEFYYLRRMAALLRIHRANKSLAVHLADVEAWSPQGAPVEDAGLKLAHHIRRNYIRIQPLLQERVQQIAAEIAQRISAGSSVVYLQLQDNPRYVHSSSPLRPCARLYLCILKGLLLSCLLRPVVHLFLFCFQQPIKCSSANCHNTVNWSLVAEGSQYADWQKIRLQEPSGEMNGAALPRCIDVIARHSLVDSVYAGDVVLVTGALIAVPDLPALLKPGELPRSVSRQMQRRTEASSAAEALRGLKGLGVRELSFRICLLALNIESVATGKHEQAIQDDRELFQASDFLGHGAFDWIRSVAARPDCLSYLVKSVAPRVCPSIASSAACMRLQAQEQRLQQQLLGLLLVWGHEDIKKGLLLTITGGVTKETGSSRLRGDLNMCIVGDPSTSKSQLLKWTEGFAPRAVFASGKGSTAAGLTAAVVRDPDQGDYVLEAGALMYADQGICCIDEFDKMDDKDRVAIHEAMEQQTISIAKAGIQATLNARASVLAACNPRFGRYDRSKSFAANAALHMSPEDVAANPGAAEAAADRLTQDELRLYVECAQKLKPLMTEAVARLHFSDFVREEHVQEAAEIFRASLHRITQTEEIRLTVSGGPAEKRGDELGEQQQDEPQEEVSVSHADYKRIASQLVDFVSQQENAAAGEPQPFQGVSSNAVIEWWIEEILQPDDPEELDPWHRKLRLIIQRLVEQDGYLLVSQTHPPQPPTAAATTTAAVAAATAAATTIAAAAAAGVEKEATMLIRLLFSKLLENQETETPCPSMAAAATAAAAAEGLLAAVAAAAAATAAGAARA
ncbi:hypothetical protein Emag_003235 [Eimeria magna]